MKPPSVFKVGILGAGQWGNTLAMLAAKSESQVILYDFDADKVNLLLKTRENPVLKGIPIPKSIHITNDLAEVFSKSDLIMPVIPAKVFRSFAKTFSKLVRPQQMIVHGTKGLDPTTYERMSEILFQELPTKKIGALSGPNLAIELAQGQPGATVVASSDDELIQYTQKALSSSQFRIYGNPDLVGVEWAGALKNILAVGTGITTALGFGQNAVSFLITRGLAEFSRLMSAMNAHSATLLGLAGIGDVITTCTSPLSRNFRAGQMLAKGMALAQIEKEMGMTIEGLNTMKVVKELSANKNIDLPITTALYQIAYEKRRIDTALRDLMDRPSTNEFQYVK